jgi:hypothetical protein
MGQKMTVLLVQAYDDDLRLMGLLAPIKTSINTGYCVLQCFPASLGGPTEIQTEHVLAILDANHIRYTGFGYGLEEFDAGLSEYRRLRPDDREDLFSREAEKRSEGS